MSSYGKAPRFERVAPSLGHFRHSPRWIPNHVNADLFHAWLAHETLAHVVEDELGRWAAHRGEGEVDVDDAVVLVDRIDHAQVDEVHRHLRILDLRQRGPQLPVHDWWWVLRKLWNSSWSIATISLLRGPLARQRTSTSSQLIGSLKSQRFASASTSPRNGYPTSHTPLPPLPP